ncbi:class I SAM-dependent methyltransferase [uncultured Alteromonas sp.]|jgi:2-polyprenyl-3-methyl-5-hydroxy-6-metoxy-1,4-benzoquinol methylase|uniref:class I SAM-dependent methyltransferase n=1 Tax=uncultured Alteromonas sp. TaxID=179113 RepID=UPI0030D88956
MSSCKYCGNQSTLTLKAQDINRKISSELFDYYRCSKCNFLFLNNIPQNLGEYYPLDYYGPTPVRASQLLNAAKIHEGFKLELVKKYCLGIKHVLEIGPSMGGFALLCKSAGLDVRTIEMSDKCADFLNHVAQIPTVLTDNEALSVQAEEQTDLIALWHVIEHLVDPFHLIETCASRIRQGGYILIAAPNPDALQFVAFKESWVHLDAPRHTCLIPISILSTLLEKFGFEIVLSTTLDEGSKEWTRFGWTHSLNHVESEIDKNWYTSVEKKVARLELMEGYGAAYTIIAKKL